MSIESILRELSSEISSSIRALSVNRPIHSSTAKFKEHDKTKTGSPITETTGHARLFDIGDWRILPRWHKGVYLGGPVYGCTVTIVYPHTPEWNRAAIDDIDEIRHWFLNHNNPSVTGVAVRHFDMEEIVQPTKFPEDDWDYYQITMMAWVETAFTNN